MNRVILFNPFILLEAPFILPNNTLKSINKFERGFVKMFGDVHIQRPPRIEDFILRPLRP
ncbi:hypothetical protein H5410_064720 [Solanum commersonii]|uniref:Uncharacterized protein n=1 Tax=Solanum commersonii TaxID=4109 RepID=A0A9J5VYK9_SOLCO|nr:hypothetical protein H5410_064720 [Solanum commersonii]